MKLLDGILKKIKISLFQLALIAGAAVLLVFIVPQIMNAGKVFKEVAEKKAVLNSLDSGIKNVSVLEQELSSLISAYNNFISRLPLQKEFPVFLELLSKLAKNNNIKIIAIEPQKVIDDPKLFFVRIPVNIDASCSYHDLGKFINDLEYSDRIMKIQDIKISGDDVNPDRHHVFLVIHTFCAREGMNATVTP